MVIFCIHVCIDFQDEAFIWTWQVGCVKFSDVNCAQTKIYKINYLLEAKWLIYVLVNSHHCFRWWPVAWSPSSNYVNQCWNIVNWTIRNQLQWNINQNAYIFIHENALENVVWKMVAIFSRPQCVKKPGHVEYCISKWVCFSDPAVVTWWNPGINSLALERFK